MSVTKRANKEKSNGMASNSTRTRTAPDTRVVGGDTRRSGFGPVIQRMTPNQEVHLASIIKRFGEKCSKKYRAGQAEHGGDMWDMSAMALVDNAINEAIDQVVYLLTLKDRLTKVPRF